MFIDEAEVIHRGVGLGFVFFQPGNAHHELFALQSQALFEGKVAVDVLAEFTALAFDADGGFAIDEHENVDFMLVAVA